MKNKFLKVVCLVTAVCASAVPSFAALSAPDQALILAGINDSDAVFYSIGGGILVVMAGIWGFKRVKSLMGG